MEFRDTIRSCKLNNSRSSNYCKLIDSHHSCLKNDVLSGRDHIKMVEWALKLNIQLTRLDISMVTHLLNTIAMKDNMIYNNVMVLTISSHPTCFNRIVNYMQLLNFCICLRDLSLEDFNDKEYDFYKVKNINLITNKLKSLTMKRCSSAVWKLFLDQANNLQILNILNNTSGCEQVQQSIIEQHILNKVNLEKCHLWCVASDVVRALSNSITTLIEVAVYIRYIRFQHFFVDLDNGLMGLLWIPPIEQLHTLCSCLSGRILTVEILSSPKMDALWVILESLPNLMSFTMRKGDHLLEQFNTDVVSKIFSTAKALNHLELVVGNSNEGVENVVWKRHAE